MGVRRAQLTPECMDLLNKIFVIDQNQRITVPNIKAHTWYTKPLLDKYLAAEEALAKRQETLNAYVAQRQLNSVRRPQTLYICVMRCRALQDICHCATHRIPQVLAAHGCGVALPSRP